MRDNVLGLIMEGEGLLTRQQVRRVVEEQQRMRAEGLKYLPFGELALKLGLVNVQELRQMLHLQRKLAYPAIQGRRLGVYLLELRLITPTALAEALERQVARKQRLGEILVADGKLSRATLEALLELQAQDRRRSHLSNAAVLEALKAVASGRPLAEVCQGLGLAPVGPAADGQSLHALVAGLQEENLALKRRLQRLGLELEALKAERAKAERPQSPEGSSSASL